MNLLSRRASEICTCRNRYYGGTVWQKLNLILNPVGLMGVKDLTLFCGVVAELCDKMQGQGESQIT